MSGPNDNVAGVDYIKANGDGSTTTIGGVAGKLLQHNFNINALRTQDVLRKDEWIKFDERVIEVATQRLTAVQDLTSRGLTYSIPNALGITRVEWETVSDMMDADISMSGLTVTPNDRVTFTQHAVPLPIVHKDFFINLRTLESSRRMGASLDTMQVDRSARIVSEKIESLLFNGSNMVGTSFTIPGYRTHDDRNTGSTTADWNTATGDQIVGDILRMIGAAVGDHMYGPYMLYASTAAGVHMGDDYKSNSDKTIIQRVKEIPGILDVKFTEYLGNNEALLVQMTSDVVDMIDGIQPQTVMWESHGGFLINFKVLAIMVPRIKSDDTGQSGIVHFT